MIVNSPDSSQGESVDTSDRTILKVCPTRKRSCGCATLGNLVPWRLTSLAYPLSREAFLSEIAQDNWTTWTIEAGIVTRQEAVYRSHHFHTAPAWRGHEGQADHIRDQSQGRRLINALLTPYRAPSLR